jgi:hypothetical protein
MGAEQSKHVAIGRITVPFETAAGWIRDYTDEAHNSRAHDPYAFPAYDRYDADHNEPGRLSDGDLLAPILLNVPLSLRAFYGLQAVRGQLEAALVNPNLALSLAELEDPQQVAAAVKPLYAVLDGNQRPPGVKGTTLSKVLHRKRPGAVALHDIWVRACYVSDEPDAPVRTARQRSWADYMTEISVAIGHDLRTQRDSFSRLDALTPTPGELTHLRLLDILAWTSKGRPLTEDAGAEDEAD